MSGEADWQCRWFVAFVCSPDWMTAANRAIAQTAHLKDFAHAGSVARFALLDGSLQAAAAHAISLGVGRRNAPLAHAWELLSLRSDDEGGRIRAVVHGAMGLVVSIDDADAAEARGRLQIWLGVADGKHVVNDFFEIADAHWLDEPTAVRAMRLPASLLRHRRWDVALAALIDETEANFIRHKRPFHDDLRSPLMDRDEFRKRIVKFADELLAIGHRWSGELSIAWRMLACDPCSPESFTLILPPLTRMLANSFTSNREAALLRARLMMWWRAAAGECIGANASIFWIADRETEHIDYHDPDVTENSAFASKRNTALNPKRPSGPTVVVMRGKLAEKRGLPTDWKDLSDVSLPLVVARDVARIRNALYTEYPHARQAVDLLTRDLREGQPVRMRPMLLLGPPGGGKSRLVRRFAEIISASRSTGSPTLYVYRYDGAAAADGMYAGLSKGWSSGHPSVPARAIMMGRQANPIAMVDEIEKAGESRHNGNLWNAMAPFLERETSARYRETGIDAELDLSHVNHLATANSIDRLPAPLRDRFRVVRIPNPTLAHLPTLAAQVMQDLSIDDETRSHDEPLAGDELEIIGHAWAREKFSMRKLQRLVGATLEARDQCARRH